MVEVYYKDQIGTVYMYDTANPNDGSLIQAAVEKGWVNVSANWPPAPVPLTLAQQAAALIGPGASVTINSTGTAADNGVYAVDPVNISFIMAEVLSLNTTSAFTDGATTIQWPDLQNPPVLHTFTTAEFLLFAKAVDAFVHACRKCIIGVTGATLPSTALTIV